MRKYLQALLPVLLTLFFINPVAAKGEEYHFKTGTPFDTDLAWKVLRQSLQAVPSDLYRIATAPFRYPGQTLLYGGLVGGLVAADKPITTFYQEHIEEPLDLYKLPTLFYSSAITHGADSWLVYGSVAHYLTGFALGDEKSQVTAIMAMKAMTYSYLVDHVLLKSVFGRRRPMNDLKHCTDANPTHTCNPHDFSPFQPLHFNAEDGRTSMPSFHLTMYFSVAKVYQEMYDNYWLPYGVLALIFSSNIKGHHHWVGDMVAGGIIGTMIGSQVVSNYRNRYLKKQSDFTISPTGKGVIFQYRF